MYRNFIQGYREAIPSGLPARLADPDLMAAGKPTFLRIGEGNEPRNELLRVIKQYPSKDEVRTKVLGQMFPPTDTDPYFARPDNIAAIRTASEQLGIPLERTGLRIATNPFRLEGDVTDVNLLAQITNKAAGDLKRSGKPTVANALTRKAQFFNQPRSYRELAVDGSEGVEAILEAYNKAEPRRTANSQGNRPILVQADGLDPNIGIPIGSPENIPPMDIEGMKGANRYVDVSQGLETARVIEYPNIYDRLNKGAQPIVTATIPYAADIPTAVGDSILSPKVSIETKRPRFIDTGEGQSLAGQVALLRRATKGLKVQGEGAVNLLDLVKAEQAKGTGIYTRSGEPINAEQKNLLDTGMADLEDRSFILQPQERAMASPLPVKYYFSTDDWAESKGLPIGSLLRRQEPVRALASALPPNYYSQRERNIPATPEAIPPTRMARDINNTPIYYSELPLGYYGIKRDIPSEDRAKYSTQRVRGNYATGVTVVDDSKPLTDEIGSIIGYKPTAKEHRKSKRLGFEALGIGRQDLSTLNIPKRVNYIVEDGVTTKNLWGTDIEVPTGRQAINSYVEPSQSKKITAVIPVRRTSDKMSDRILADPNYLKQFEPFKSNRNTYGATQGKTPWREYYSDPLVYEDKGLDGEVARLVKAVNEAPAQLENALSNQAVANRKAMELETAIQSFRRIAKGGKKADISMSPEMMIELAEVAPRIREWKSLRRGNEVAAAKAQDRIAELRASQELLGTEYMVKPKKWGEDVLSGYRIGSDTVGGVRDSNEIPVNDKFSEEVFDRLIVSQDPLVVEGKPTRRAAKPNGWTIKPNAVQIWREALQQEALDNRRDYDIASTFGFSGNY